jgi:hypothetical protein
LHLYLSPHHDDVCFSIGHIARQQGGDLINLFTRSEYVEAPIPLPEERQARIEAVTRIRKSEDILFAKACGLVRHDLQLPEPSLLGFTSRDSSNLEGEIEALSARLLALLAERLQAKKDPRTVALYCPMGIGGHRNHLSTLMTVHRNLGLIEKSCTLFLYEDLHYASSAPVREEGIQRVLALFRGYRLNRFIARLSWPALLLKMEDIQSYRSQHREPPRIRRFIPASDISPMAHESIWRVEAI